MSIMYNNRGIFEVGFIGNDSGGPGCRLSGLLIAEERGDRDRQQTW